MRHNEVIIKKQENSIIIVRLCQKASIKVAHSILNHYIWSVILKLIFYEKKIF